MSLYNKEDGEGYRVWIAGEKLEPYPELRAWFLKLRSKNDQDSAVLQEEIRRAGNSIFLSRPIVVRSEFLVKRKKGDICMSPLCGEAYPRSDGGVCRSCQGEVLKVSDLGRLRSMGRRKVYLEEEAGVGEGWVPENEAAEVFGRAMAGDGVVVEGPPREGRGFHPVGGWGGLGDHHGRPLR